MQSLPYHPEHCCGWYHCRHFNWAIFEWRKHREGITYILSKDIYKHRRANKEDADVWLAKGGTWSDGTISVWALGSTDSFFCCVAEDAAMPVGSFFKEEN